jgi:hypothetical protein
MTPTALLFQRMGYICCILATLINNMAAATPTIIMLSDSDPTAEPKNAYRYELYKLLLDVTTAEYGEYRIQSTIILSSANRAAALITQGDQLNMQWASPGTPIAKARVIPIPVDIVFGLMGYRICITTDKGQQKLDSVNDLLFLQKNIRIGQGVDWSDADIYQSNAIAVTKAPTLDGLFGMLSANRIECLALGADEVRAILKVRQSSYPTVGLEPKLVIYYDYPIYLYVSANHPEIAARIKRGFEIIQNSGEFKRLFDRFYQKEIGFINIKDRRLICIHSPFSTKTDQCEHLEQLMLRKK